MRILKSYGMSTVVIVWMGLGFFVYTQLCQPMLIQEWWPRLTPIASWHLATGFAVAIFLGLSIVIGGSVLSCAHKMHGNSRSRTLMETLADMPASQAIRYLADEGFLRLEPDEIVLAEELEAIPPKQLGLLLAEAFPRYEGGYHEDVLDAFVWEVFQRHGTKASGLLEAFGKKHYLRKRIECLIEIYKAEANLDRAEQKADQQKAAELDRLKKATRKYHAFLDRGPLLTWCWRSLTRGLRQAWQVVSKLANQTPTLLRSRSVIRLPR